MTSALLALLVLTVAPNTAAEARYPGAKTVFQCDFGPSWDENYDGWPDGWTRRRGPGYPHYLEAKISEEPSPVDNRCVRIDLDGGGAVLYSPPVDVSWLYSYVLEGQLKTEGLIHDRAFLGLTFLDEKRTPLASYSTEPVRETDGWKKFRLGPVEPPGTNVHTAVIELHLEPGSRADLSGAALFDDLWLGRLPRMALSTSVPHNVFTSPGDVEIRCRASGFSQQQPRIAFCVEDVHGRQLSQSQRPLVARRVAGGAEWSLERFTDDPSGQVGQLTWKPPLVEPGFYRVHAELVGDGGSSCRRELTLALIEPWPRAPGSEFGWSLPRGAGPLGLPVLGRLLDQMGLHWVKYPLWYGQQASEAQIEDMIQFSERLATSGIEMIGLLDQPPPEIRVRYGSARALNAAEVFTAAPEVWYPSVEPVLTRFSTRVQWWQLGDDKDTSFTGCLGLNEKLSGIKAQLDRVGEDVNLGVAWSWLEELPKLDEKKQPLRFLALSAEPPLTHEEISTYLLAARLGESASAAASAEATAAASPAAPPGPIAPASPVAPGAATAPAGSPASAGAVAPGAPTTPTSPAATTVAGPSAASRGGSDGAQQLGAWVVLEPLRVDEYPTDVRATDLVRRMMAAKIDGANAIFATDPFDANRGLLRADGTPGELLLVWRTTAMLLGGSHYLGSIVMPGGSPNRVFAREKDAVMIIWNDKPCEEVLYLGDEARQVDLWGRSTTPEKDGHQQVLRVGPVPSLVVGVNKYVARWQMDFALEKDRIPSVFGKQHANAVEIRNPFPRGVGGQVDLVVPDIWTTTPRRITFRLAAGETIREPFEILLPYDASNGVHRFRADFEIQADRPYRFSVHRQIEVGLGGVHIEYSTRLNARGQLEVVQNFINATDERVSFRCQLSAPGRPRQETRVLDLARGSRVRIYHLPDGQELVGKTLWIRAQEVGGPRKLNYRFNAEK